MYMNLKTLNVIPNFVVQLIDGDEIWVSRNYSLYRSKIGEDRFEKVIDLPFSFCDHVVGRSRLLSRALRLGIRSVLSLKSGTFLVNSQKKIFRIEENGMINEVFHFNKGLGPLRQGWCEDNDGNCYLGEYLLNSSRKDKVKLFKSDDDGLKWQIIKEFDDIRHIHCVQYDKFSNSIWLGTGDREQESSISFSENGGESWSIIGGGEETFRTVSFIFTKNHVYWGTDSPTKHNYIYRYHRKNGEIEKLSQVDGPIHYSIEVSNLKLFATVVEGKSEGKTLQLDKKAHIWCSNDSENFEDLVGWKKDSLPYILGFGRIIFPLGFNSTNELYFTTQSLKGVDNVMMRCEIEF